MTDAELIQWARAYEADCRDKHFGAAARKYARIAEAVEENARLRDMLDDTVGALEALCGERPAWQYLLDEVRAALRKPDAAE